MAQFLTVPLKPRSFGEEKKDSLKAQALKRVKEAFDADDGTNAFKLILMRAPATSVIEFGQHAYKPSEEAEGLKGKIEGLEIFDVYLQPEVGVISSQMNIPEKKSGK